ncbi:MAG: glycoside hydrolase family 127 protein, partial [Anaerolineae bacterium]|nr:glycoside hydrolase family 127 protein [Anaerolineae bacterium]
MTDTNSINAIPLKDVRLEGGFWGERQAVNRSSTLPTVLHQSKVTGRLDAWKLEWKPGQPNKPHYFWDSDAAKWIEAAAYSLTNYPDAELEREVDAVVDLIEKAQQPDGYLNIYFTAVEPQNRWRNLRDWHELYCAGHLIEAAVAYVQATGKRALLDVMCRYVDYIDTVLGPNEGQKRGYPGHPEIELALVKLYRATGERRYFNLSKFFVDERGQQPHYYDLEARERGADPADYWARHYRYTQSHVPIREQTEMMGHAVRACYLYAGATDVALETGDDTLAAAMKRLWENLTEKQMYITGGVGQSAANEGFTFNYDLPDETAYAETCGAISLVFWAQRMFHLDHDSRYTDVMERALYNGVMSGLSLDGTHFFYANPLSAHHHVNPYNQWATILEGDKDYRRSEWFSCACCPPNIARLIASLGQYFYSTDATTVYAHLFGQSTAQVEAAGHAIQLTQQTNYPWDETVQIRVDAAQPVRFTLAVRLPGWCRAAALQVNGETIQPRIDKGYAYLDREWQPGDSV